MEARRCQHDVIASASFCAAVREAETDLGGRPSKKGRGIIPALSCC